MLTIDINPLFFINGYRGYKVILNPLEIFIMKDKSPIETDIKTTEVTKRVSKNQKKYPARIWTTGNKTIGLVIVFFHVYVLGRTK